MIYYYTYKITCTAGSFNGKVYYGQHTTDNLNDGYKGSGRKIRDYYKKHPDDFIMEILNYYQTQKELDNAEYELIKPHLGKDYCLNMAEGGKGGNLGEYVNKKISEGNKGRTYSEETKKKISEGNKGKTHSEETKKKISEAEKGKKCSAETKKKMSEAKKGENNPMYGKTLSYGTRNKMSESHKGKNKGKHWKLVDGKRVWY